MEGSGSATLKKWKIAFHKNVGLLMSNMLNESLLAFPKVILV